MQKQLVLFVLLLLSIVVNAKIVEIDGIYYNLYPKVQEAEVTKKSSSNYTGHVNIPESITYGGVVFSVKGIEEQAFKNSYITSITIPSCITRIGGSAFQDCKELTSVHISDLKAWCNISLGGSYSNPLYYAKHLYMDDNEIKDLVIPNDVSIIGSFTFSGCSGLTSISISNSVTSIGECAFSKCTGLKSVVIGNCVESIDTQAFMECSGLESITFSNSVKTVSFAAFGSCNNLSAVHIPDIASWCNVNFESETSNPLYFAKHLYMEGVELSDLVIPNGVKTIGSYVFYGYSNLVSVHFPNTLTSIGDHAFSNCNRLSSVTIPNSVTSMEGGVFSYCYELKSVEISNSLSTIASGTFSNCKNLTTIKIPNSITSIEYASFTGCTSLTSIVIPNSVTSIGSYCFNGCCNLKSVTLSNNLNSLGSYVFWQCTSLSSISIPNNLKKIEDKTFFECSSLETVVLGSNVEKLGKESFAKCEKLKDVYCFAKTVPFADYRPLTFNETDIDFAHLHVPSNLIEEYKKTYPWSAFLSIEAWDGEPPIEPEVKKCGKPAVLYTDGEVIFSSETDGVEFESEIEVDDVKTLSTSTINLSMIYNVSVIATKSGYENSDVTSMQFTITGNGNKYMSGDINNDQLVNVADIVAITNIIKEENASAMSPKCDTPTVCYSDGKIEFGCKTEGVEYVSEVKNGDMKKYNVAEITLSLIYEVSVYAQKAGYENSEVVTREIIITGNGKAIVVGDANGDGKVDAADIVTTTNIIMEKK